MKVVIPSKGRASIIGQRTLAFLPDALVCVAESEAEAYSDQAIWKGRQPNLLVHPDSVIGMGPKRQWILDTLEDETVVMVDDDMTAFYSIIGFRPRKIEDPQSIMCILERTALVAKEAGAGVFGYCQTPVPMNYSQNHFRPFAVQEWVGGTIGFIGRQLRYDPLLILRADIDFCLQSLLKHRIIWMDVRYRFEFGKGMFDGKGGGSVNRTNERSQAEIDHLLKKWGKWLTAINDQNVVKLRVNVKR